MMSPRRYVFAFILSILSFSILTVSVNYMVDPYLMMDTKRWQGFNLYKTEISKHLKMSKAYHPNFGEWDTLLVGNSRIEMGLDPHHSCFQKSANKVYNLGLPGADVRQQLEYALNLIYQQPIEKVFLSIDFVDFLVLNEWRGPEGEPDLSAPSGSLKFTFNGSKNPDHTWAKFMDHYRALFSLDALLSSLQTLSSQSPRQSDRTSQGFNPARDYKHGVNVEGAHAFFAQKMSVMENKYSKGWSLRYHNDSPSQSFAMLANFLEIAKKKKIKVILFTNPFHQKFWALLRDNNLYEMHQLWLNEVKTLVSNVDSPHTSLWDFSTDPRYINEEIPASHLKGNPLTWFWEPTHYRKALGDLMLNRMLADQCQIESEFGAKIL